MTRIKPNFDWYSERGAKLKLPPRCPIASAELCPRYYASWWLLGNAGISTEISPQEKRRLDRKWEPFKSSVSEEEAGIARADGKFVSVDEFCPEVSYEVFGSFASSLHRYADELDRDHAQERLGREGASADDPRWQWASVTPRHYTECREYSIHGTGPRRSTSRPRRPGIAPGQSQQRATPRPASDQQKPAVPPKPVPPPNEQARQGGGPRPKR